MGLQNQLASTGEPSKLWFCQLWKPKYCVCKKSLGPIKWFSGGLKRFWQTSDVSGEGRCFTNTVCSDLLKMVTSTKYIIVWRKGYFENVVFMTDTSSVMEPEVVKFRNYSQVTGLEVTRVIKKTQWVKCFHPGCKALQGYFWGRMRICLRSCVSMTWRRIVPDPLMCPVVLLEQRYFFWKSQRSIYYNGSWHKP